MWITSIVRLCDEELIAVVLLIARRNKLQIVPFWWFWCNLSNPLGVSFSEVVIVHHFNSWETIVIPPSGIQLPQNIIQCQRIVHVNWLFQSFRPKISFKFKCSHSIHLSTEESKNIILNTAQIRHSTRHLYHSPICSMYSHIPHSTYTSMYPYIPQYDFQVYDTHTLAVPWHAFHGDVSERAIRREG